MKRRGSWRWCFIVAQIILFGYWATQQVHAVPYESGVAYNYAEKYAFKVCSDGYFFEESYPPSYLGVGVPVPSGGYDCAHFVSCCIGSEPHEKGGGLNVPSRTEAYGEPSANLLGDWLLDSGIGTEVFSVEELKKGSFINYDWDGNGSWDHVALYLGDHKIAAHSESHWNDDWKLGGAAKYRFIYIPESTSPSLTDWPFIQRDLQNTGNNPDALNLRNPKIKDSLTIEGTWGYAQPIAEGNMVYVASGEGYVYRVDMKSLQYPPPFYTGAQEIKVTPALAGNKLYVLDSNNVLWVLNKKTGQALGNAPIGLDYYWQTAPQVWKNYILFTVGPYIVRVRDDIPEPQIQAVDSRRFVKAKSEEGYDFLATGAIKDGVFYCMNCACQVLAVNIENWQILWDFGEIPVPKEIGNLKYLGNPKCIVLAGDVLVLKNNWRYDFNNPYAQEGETGFIYAINIKTHDKILWNQEIGLGSASPVFKDNGLYPFGLFARPGVPGAIDGIIYCLDPKTGDLLTPKAISVNDDVELSIGGGVMYLACWNFKKVFGVIFDPFEILWQRDTLAHPFSAVVPVSNEVYVSMIEFKSEAAAMPKKMSLRPAKPIHVQIAESIVIASFSEAPPEFKKGDVSQDGQITAHDAQLIMKHVVGQNKLTPEQLELADVSGNGQVSAYDAGLVMQMCTGVKIKKGVIKK